MRHCAQIWRLGSQDAILDRNRLETRRGNIIYMYVRLDKKFQQINKHVKAANVNKILMKFRFIINKQERQQRAKVSQLRVWRSMPKRMNEQKNYNRRHEEYRNFRTLYHMINNKDLKILHTSSKGNRLNILRDV